MGKKKRLNRLITKWIKSDLPDDRSPVLLLGVTKIPTTPTPPRRPCSLPLGPIVAGPGSAPRSRRGSFRRLSSQRKHCGGAHHLEETSQVPKQAPQGSEGRPGGSSIDSDDITPSAVNSPSVMMDRSVDSIDWSEQSSVGTLRSVSLVTPEPQPHLPSYLSLACTVSGYSPTTNYDPERLAKSRDASPHRLHDELASTPQNKTPLYSIRNNLLSPPNIVPLPNQKFAPEKNMEEQLVTRREFYSSKTTSFMTKESRNFVSSMFSDSVDGCISNGFHNGQNKCMTLESKTTNLIINGSGKTMSETSYKEFSNGLENKSFIQQRVERLYGPGALAQGFFISKRQKNRSTSDPDDKSRPDNDVHSKSMINDPSVSESENILKQSTSSPTLPVLRHLRPEFRAQLTISSPKKGTHDSSFPKSSTVPVFKEEPVKVNGHSKSLDKEDNVRVNGTPKAEVDNHIKVNEVQNDGHYFLKILDKETKRLLDLAGKIEQELEDEKLSEEIKGKLRAASGKARLLTSQKMQQFRGLCTNNINQPTEAEFPTTCEDLHGFWDMVLLQVDQVDALFGEIDELRRNNWVEVKPLEPEEKTSNPAVARPRKSATSRSRPASSVNEEARKEREAKRKQLIEERRKAMREQMQQQKDKGNIEFYVPESS